jgi:nucleoside-diphosphate-sugar epimerase
MAAPRMVRLGMVGANGQVGAELCLMFAGRDDVELIPICRNRSGSAFLRWHGIACRHGRVADPGEAARLLSDCDIVVNSSLAGGSPSQIRRVEDQIIGNIFRYSKRSATVIHFSTQSVYGDPRPNRRIRWRNPYGRAKLVSERKVRAEARAAGKAAYVLRLGHVCGALQEISNTIRASIRAQSVLLPAENHSSNTVYTSAIIGAIDQIIARCATPGTYDLMNTPRWTWREVYEYEAGACQLPLNARLVSTTSRKSRIRATLTQLGGSLTAAQPVRDLFAKAFATVPESMNARTMAWWYVRRARAEIAALTQRQEVPDHLSWVENGRNFFPAASPTSDLLAAAPPFARVPTAVSWVADLPDASPQSVSDVAPAPQRGARSAAMRESS